MDHNLHPSLFPSPPFLSLSLCIALPWFTDLGIKAADTLLSTHNPHTVNKSALEEAAQKVKTSIFVFMYNVLISM